MERRPDVNDRGAVLVHVALAMLALIAFTTFVVDYGVLWVSRRQAQNGADAGALAAAGSYAFDVPNDEAAAKIAGELVAETNLVFGQAPAVDPATDINFITCPPGSGAGTCVKVDVYRDPAHGNALPMIFGPLVGLTQQGVKATATARISGANSVRCALPWAMADRWADDFDENPDGSVFVDDPKSGIDGWSPNDLFQRPQGDFYKSPYFDDTTGWSTTRDWGRQIILHEAKNQFSPGWSGTVNLPNSIGACEYAEDIRGCNETVISIAPQDSTCSGYSGSSTTEAQAKAGCLGIATGVEMGPTKQGIEQNGGCAAGDPIVGQDPDVSWSWAVNGGPNGEKGGVVDKSGKLTLSTPRIRPLPVFDIDHYMDQVSSCSGTGCVVKISNIIGFFVEGMCDTMSKAGKLDKGLGCDPETQPQAQVVGRIVTIPGSFATGAGTPVTPSSFVKIIMLVR